jgi:hypothetical protein
MPQPGLPQTANVTSLYGSVPQPGTQQPPQQTLPTQVIPDAPPGQVPRPDTVHYCAPSNQDGQHLNC